MERTAQKTGETVSYYGWSYCAATPERDFLLLYFENDAAPEATLRGAVGHYRPAFFDPRSGTWQPPGEPLAVAPSSLLTLPPRPDARDWGLMLERVG